MIDLLWACFAIRLEEYASASPGALPMFCCVRACTRLHAIARFDRCCIDQTNVDSDLRCLPIFLKGCRRLVVFCGETYLSRLWCIIEIFTYVHMGGLVEDVQVQAVVRAGREEEDFQSIMQTFSCFDVAACRCFNAEDKHRLLAMVDVAYGSTHVFNTVIRGIVSFVHMSIHREISASRSFAATGCSSNPELEIKTE